MKFVRWVFKNKEWLFSGVGVVILMCVYNFFFNTTEKKTNRLEVPVEHSTKLAEQKPDTKESSKEQKQTVIDNTDNKTPKLFDANNPKIIKNDNSTKLTDKTAKNDDSKLVYSDIPTAKNIVETIENLPPYQREQQTNNYIGLPVKWQTTLYSLHTSNENVFLFLNINNQYPWISCHVKLNDYPELKIANSGTGIILTGLIKSIHGHDIELSNVKIVSLQKNQISEKDNNELNRSKQSNKCNAIDIVQTIEKLPPYQREEAAKNYVGLPISWETTFVSLSISQDIARLFLNINDRYPWITCSVKLNEYPELKVANSGTRIRLTGSIKYVRGHDIELEKVKIAAIEN